ncbi:amidohydrolase family protein [Mycoplasma sp. ATU-Cv-508]|uniref:amidohydrolase family protein n=1 Tax=Mycoplasma sp. ATU-Cv-508 TaxID=2048001 RepID=UPI00191BBC1B
MKKGFIVKGHIVYTSKPSQFELIENGHIVVEDDVIKAVGKDIPSQYHSYPVSDYKDKLIIPGLVDTHIHAPQFTNRGLGLDKELLLGWKLTLSPRKLSSKIWTTLAKFTTTLLRPFEKNGVTSSVVFNTIHKDATKLLLDMFKNLVFHPWSEKLTWTLTRLITWLKKLRILCVTPRKLLRNTTVNTR